MTTGATAALSGEIDASASDVDATARSFPAPVVAEGKRPEHVKIINGDDALQLRGADVQRVWVCEGLKVSATNLADLVADSVSERLQILIQEQQAERVRLLETIETRLVQAMNDLLPNAEVVSPGLRPQGDSNVGASDCWSPISCSTRKTFPSRSALGERRSCPAALSVEIEIPVGSKVEAAPEVFAATEFYDTDVLVRQTTEDSQASQPPITSDISPKSVMKPLRRPSISSKSGSSIDRQRSPESPFKSEEGRILTMDSIGNCVYDNVLQDLLQQRRPSNPSPRVPRSLVFGANARNTAQPRPQTLTLAANLAAASPTGSSSPVSASQSRSEKRKPSLLNMTLGLARMVSTASSKTSDEECVEFDSIPSLRGRTTDMVIQNMQSASGPSPATGIGIREQEDDDERDGERTSEDSSDTKTEPLSRMSMLFLRICGILPWTSLWNESDRPVWQRPSTWYQWLLFPVAASGLVCYLQYFSQSQDTSIEFDCHSYVLLSDIPLMLGCCLGLFALAQTNSEALVETFRLLHSYSCSEKFDKKWIHLVHWDSGVTLLLWAFAIFERLRGTSVLQRSFRGELDSWATLRIIAFVTCSFLLLMISACALFCCRALSSAVDAFCSSIVGSDTLDKAVPRWNVVQALLRKVSGTIQTCMLVLLTSMILTFMLLGFDFYQIHSQVSSGGAESVACIPLLVPGALLILSLWRVFFKVSEVSDKCARVPSLINACIFSDDETDPERQYVVEYVLHSAAGFYMFELQVTSDITLKFTYFSVVAMFALITNFVSGD